ncbi:hypothetical protein B0H63DRAFT_468655 [Podospora didyma]|uniref:Uncharacterized protein n=1 Tax=Podospora didyma TaxID=330526 RepID=A0AAE0NSI9_9PEZI|nr:hypothetical protein B0H63DRAFT_468655 [Podospora didyma]
MEPPLTPNGLSMLEFARLNGAKILYFLLLLGALVGMGVGSSLQPVRLTHCRMCLADSRWCNWLPWAIVRARSR